jgi:DNA topoisomerase 2-associated protein PAT1
LAIVTHCPQTDGLVRQDPLSQRQILAILENLYDLVLKVEQLRRNQPALEDEEGIDEW